jgi:hypothetical protein
VELDRKGGRNLCYKPSQLRASKTYIYIYIYIYIKREREGAVSLLQYTSFEGKHEQKTGIVLAFLSAGICRTVLI